MCKYYAHSFACKHTSFTFARFCRDANMIQTPCGARDVWTTIRMDEACGECKTYGFAQPQSPRHQTAVRRPRS